MTILVVQQKDQERELVVKLLDEGNVHVRAAASTHEAIKIIDDFKPEILVTDLSTSQVDGIRLIEAAHDASEQARVVVAFDTYAPKDLVRAVELGVDAFVRLPADGIKLRDAVMRCARKIVTTRRMAQMDYSLQQLLDFFPGPAVLVDDMEVNYMNRPLAAFLGFESFAKMTERDVGLEDYIVKLNDEPYNGHPNEWIDSMVNDPLDRDHVLHIENPRHPKSRAHVFGVTFNQFPGSNLRLFSFQDVSALEDEKAVLEDEAATDPLTGALNRRSFLRLLDTLVASEESFGLIMFDIDHFKVINDTFGHDAGDTVLCEMTQLVGENIRGKDTLARWGGEEFMVLSPGQDSGRVRRMAERLRQGVAGFSFSGLSRPVTASFGVVHASGTDREELIRQVDQALYKAKETGRNKVVLSD
ncbi:diguanylate cyclase [Pseudodesulfovibrio sp. S3]|nr:diguanylate cyclase [Pseudodesulfovibrio sp. S3-i]RWU03403.1 diguanylate cyclase [Pseudodesulfovibrio sp. S3]